MADLPPGLAFDTALKQPSSLSGFEMLPPTAALPAPTPEEEAAMQEMIAAQLEKDIADATVAVTAMVAMTAPAMSETPVKSACGWGKNNDPSSLLTRVRRAPGRSVPLVVLRQEAPAELKQYMKDGTTFATWLRHRTGLLKVNGLPGEEIVAFAGSAKEQPAEHETALDPQAVEFNPIYGLDLCDMAEYMAYDEACNDMAAFIPYFEEGQSGADYALPDEFGESAVTGQDDVLNSEALELMAIGPPPGLTLEVEESGPEAEQVVKAGGLNPKAAEFRPTKALADSDKMMRARRVKTGVPDVIPEEPITGSSETASGGEDPATAYEESVSGEDEDEVAAAKAAAVEHYAVAQSSI